MKEKEEMRPLPSLPLNNLDKQEAWPEKYVQVYIILPYCICHWYERHILWGKQ